MDAQEKDRIRRRDEILARRVGEALDRMNPRGAQECPDAEIVAAYAEQALGPDDAGKWEGHFAACARCRKILRVLAASEDTPLAGKEVAQLGKLVAEVRAPVEIAAGSVNRGRPKFIGWSMRWLAPALGVAAVLAVWFAMRPPWRAMDRGTSATLVAQARKEEAPASATPADRFLGAAPGQEQKTQVAPAPDRFAENARSLNSPAGAPIAQESLRTKKKDNANLDLEAVAPAPAVAPAAPPIPPVASAPAAPALKAQAEVAGNAMALAKAPESASQSGAVAAPSPRLEAVPTAKSLSRERQMSAAPQATADVATASGGSLREFSNVQEESPIQLRAPSGTVFWRAGKSGSIERSTDAGRSWTVQASPSQEDWLAGSAASDAVCWLAGRNGTIARTMDGARWERISPPAQAAATGGKLPDWTGIAARDAQSATITASDGRRFATSDGGKTWQPQ